MNPQNNGRSAALMTQRLAFSIGFFVFVSLAPSAVIADTCDVPLAYSTIQAAVDDFACTEIFVDSGLFYGDLTIPRSLLIQGVSSTSTAVLGRVMAVGAGTSIALEGLRIEVSPEGLPHNGLATDGLAEFLPDDLVVGSSLLFSDGFESGTTSRWAETMP